jgi:hypothetical protein
MEHSIAARCTCAACAAAVGFAALTIASEPLCRDQVVVYCAAAVFDPADGRHNEPRAPSDSVASRILIANSSVTAANLTVRF